MTNNCFGEFATYSIAGIITFDGLLIVIRARKILHTADKEDPRKYFINYNGRPLILNPKANPSIKMLSQLPDG